MDPSHSFLLVGLTLSTESETLLRLLLSLGDSPHAAYWVIHSRLTKVKLGNLIKWIRGHSLMSVQLIEPGIEIRPATIYLCPARRWIGLTDGVFQGEMQPETRAVIDLSFQSIAAWGQQAVGICLSGTGEEGMTGLQAITQQGGSALIQVPGVAKFYRLGGASPVAAGPDQILSPTELAQALKQLAQPSILPVASPHLLPSEPGAWIKTPRFFQDPPIWQLLAQDVIPRLLCDLSADQPLRLWVPACGTGEDAYSLAILVREALKRLNLSNPVKIFATDRERQTVEMASRGRYPLSLAQVLTPEHLETYFQQVGDRYQAKPALRQMMIFSPQDLSNCIGFSRLHLVCCRGALSRMQPQHQHQVLRLLHGALIPQGILWLGQGEELRDLAEEFEAIDATQKLFRKCRDISLPLRPVVSLLTRDPLEESKSLWSNQFFKTVYQICFDKQGLTCFLIDANYQLLVIYENPYQLLSPLLGGQTDSVLDRVPTALRSPLRLVLERARHQEKELAICADIILRQGVQEHRITLKAKSIQSVGKESYFVVVFESCLRDLPKHSRTSVLDLVHQDRIIELELELSQAQENLQEIVREMGLRHEELITFNEELAATNEELAATNEELQALTASHAHKIEELTQLNADIDTLLHSTQIGILWLDNQLNIRRFTSAITPIINLIASDTDRPLEHLTHNLDCPDLLDLIKRVVRSGESLQRQVVLRSTQDQLLMRIHPYRSSQGYRTGIVVTFVDINHLHLTQLKLQTVHQQLETLFDAIPVGLALHDAEDKVIRVNQQMADINGLSKRTHLGKKASDLLPILQDQIGPILHQIRQTYQPVMNVEISGSTCVGPAQGQHWIAHCFPVPFEDGSLGVGVAVVEITQQKQAETLLRSREDKLSQLNQSRDTFLSMISHDLRSPLQNMLLALRMMPTITTTDRWQKYHTILVQECEHQIELVNELLDLQRLEAGRFELTIQPLDLNQELESSLRSTALRVESQRFSRHLDLIEAPFHTDRVSLQRILDELLHNAARYTPVDGEIRFWARHSPAHDLEIEVANTGEIPEEELPRLFDKFHRVERGDPHQRRGTGLGLALVKELVQAMQGQIDVSGGRGWIRFQMRLPDLGAQ